MPAHSSSRSKRLQSLRCSHVSEDNSLQEGKGRYRAHAGNQPANAGAVRKSIPGNLNGWYLWSIRKEVVRETRNFTEEELKDILNQPEVKNLCDQICDNIIWRHHSLPWNESADEKSRMKQLPTQLRPQLTASCMTRDIPDDMPSEMLLTQLALFMRETNPDKRSMYYGCFRQGLDILDLDPILYEMLGRNPNSIGNWFPALQEAASQQEYFKIPETKIMRVPLQILQMSRLQYESLTLATKYIVNRFVVNEFGLDPAKKYFIKTGVFSCEFDFRN